MSDQNKSSAAIGFPPPLLGETPQRLPVLADTAEWLALEKPAGVGTRAHPWDHQVPDLDHALNLQLQAGKPELQRLGATLFGSVYYLDPGIQGVAIFAKSRDALAELRNRFGSGEGRFVFRFVAHAGPAEAGHLESDAPLLPHRVKPKMIPSTAKGKKCATRFVRLAASEGGWAYWEARTNFFRPHQVRAHAAVCEIPVLGDKLYGAAAMPAVREVAPRSKRRTDLDKPLYRGLPIRLCEIDLGDAQIRCDLGKSFSLLLSRLGMRDNG